MKICEVTKYLETLAPLSSQESYDNSGLIVGSNDWELSNALICLDSLENVVDEAIQYNCNLIIAHHPIIFKAIKSITGKNYVEKVILKCIKNDIALYAIHTNFDNYKLGVNYEIGQRLGLNDLRVLDPKSGTFFKVIVFVPTDHRDIVAKAMFESGAGRIGNYHSCGFFNEGTGTFTPTKNANPYIGEINKAEFVPESRVEVLVDKNNLSSVIGAMKNAHPYEEIAFDVIALENSNIDLGSGMIGDLTEAVDTKEWLSFVKKEFSCGVIRHTNIIKEKVKKIAFCGGSGSFLLEKAKQQKADVYLSADFKYHEFFDAEDEILIVDIGHFESEQYTIKRLNSILTKKFPTFVPRLSKINTNPVHYF